MERPTTLEAGFLEAEDADRHLSLAIATLAIIDRPIPNSSGSWRRCPNASAACPGSPSWCISTPSN